MRIIFINRFFHPDHSATSRILSDVAFSLAGDGTRDVHVIASRMRYEPSSDPLPARETIDGVAVHRVWTSRFGRGNLLGRAIDYLTFYASAAASLWSIARAGDLVIAKTDPPMLSVLAAPVAHWRGATLINWLQDIFPEVAQNLGMSRGPVGRTVFAIVRSMRDRTLRSAAANVVLGERMSAHLTALGVPRARIRIIGNFADGKKLVPIEGGNRLRAEWQLDGKFVVGYSGNLGRAHEYQTMLAAMRLTGPNVSWLFVGAGALFGELQREAQANGLANVRFEPYQPDERLSESLSAADVHLISLLPALEGLIVPSKFYGICAVARPSVFIGDEDGEIARLITRHACGYAVRTGDGETLANILQALADNPETCREMGGRARAAFEQEFDKSIAIARWQSLLHEAAGESISRAHALSSGTEKIPVESAKAI